MSAVATTGAYAVETAFVAWSVLVVPALGGRRYRTLCDRPPGDLVGCYRRTAVQGWVVAGALVAVLLLLGTPAAALGVAVPRNPATAAAAVAAATVAGALAMTALPRRRLVGLVRALLPVTARERCWFVALALSAGATEEVLYRGVVMLWARQTVPAAGAAGWAGAVAVSAVVFGLGHAYQGAAGATAAGVGGALLGGLYAATGSLLLPALLHAVADVRVLVPTGSGRLATPAMTSPFPPTGGPSGIGPAPGACTDHAPLSSP